MFYMAVTPDKYELPMAVAESLDELSWMTGVKKTSISHAISKNRSGKATGMKFIKIDHRGVLYGKHTT